MKTLRSQFHYIITVIIAILFMNCDSTMVYEKNKKLPEMNWHYKDIITFEAEIKDTVSLHNIYINVRNSVNYRYMNFYMFLNTEFPDGRIVRDTLECFVADTRGKWTGDGFGKLKSNRFLMRENVWFPYKGIYTFSFEQAMREDVIEGISDIGIRIEKNRKYNK